MASGAPGHGTIRVHELAIPSSIERKTAALIARYIPKSSAFTMSTRASGGKPSSSPCGASGAAAAGSRGHLSMHHYVPDPKLVSRRRVWSGGGQSSNEDDDLDAGAAFLDVADGRGVWLSR